MQLASQESRAGYYWQAIRENEEAAQALGINTFRWKMLAVALSSAMTAVSGVFFAFYYNNLFPEQIFHISRSIEIILGPIIGGVGTLFGPILGAAVLTLLSDGITEGLAALGWEIPGIKQVFYGVVLLAVIMFLPQRHLAVRREEAGVNDECFLKSRAITKSFRGLSAVSDASFEIPEGSINALIGPNGAGKTTIFNMIAGVFPPDSGSISFLGRPIHGLRPDQVCAAGIGRTFQIVKPFAGLTVLDNVMVGAFLRETSAIGRPQDRKRRSSRDCSSPRSAICPPRRSPCPTASGSRSRARSPRGRSSCCSTR